MSVNIRKAARKTGVVATSLAVTAGLGVAVIAPTTVAFANTSSTSSIVGRSDVFYGKVTLDGKALNHARVVLYHFVGGYQPRNLRVDSIFFSGRNGTYRRALNLRPGRYYEQISYRESNGRVRISHPVRQLNVTPGHAYRTDARATHRGVFTFFPAGSY